MKKHLRITRECGLCRACCTTQRVDELDKPADTPCPHLAENQNAKGCSIYSNRPNSCRIWKCAWLAGMRGLEGSERPDRLGVVFEFMTPKVVPLDRATPNLCAIAVTPEEADACFERASATIKRLADAGHLIVCEWPDGRQAVYGPDKKVDEYVRKARVVVLKDVEKSE